MSGHDGNLSAAAAYMELGVLAYGTKRKERRLNLRENINPKGAQLRRQRETSCGLSLYSLRT